MQCDICDLLKNDTTLIFQTDHWKVFLMDEQSYLGRSVVSLKRHAGSLPDLSEEEWIDFKKVVERLEKAIRKTFDAQVFNWGCLMNNAFRKVPFNPHVHWHVRPRYKSKVIFAGKTFEDPDFGEHYNRDRKETVSPEILNQIVRAFKNHL